MSLSPPSIRDSSSLFSDVHSYPDVPLSADAVIILVNLRSADVQQAAAAAVLTTSS